MQRSLRIHERSLLEFLILVNKSIYEAQFDRWTSQIERCTVQEVNVPHCLRIGHADADIKTDPRSFTLAHELVALDEGVPVLIYAIVKETQNGLVLDIFSVDRLDGEPLVTYPHAGDALMIVDRNKRVGGADLRHVYGGR